MMNQNPWTIDLKPILTKSLSDTRKLIKEWIKTVKKMRDTTKNLKDFNNLTWKIDFLESYLEKITFEKDQ